MSLTKDKSFFFFLEHLQCPLHAVRVVHINSTLLHDLSYDMIVYLLWVHNGVIKNHDLYIQYNLCYVFKHVKTEKRNQNDCIKTF